MLTDPAEVAAGRSGIVPKPDLVVEAIEMLFDKVCDVVRDQFHRANGKRIRIRAMSVANGLAKCFMMLRDGDGFPFMKMVLGTEEWKIVCE